MENELDFVFIGDEILTRKELTKHASELFVGDAPNDLGFLELRDEITTFLTILDEEDKVE